MEVPSYFTDFLQNIRLTDAQIKDLKRGHSTLRDRLANDDDLAEIIVTTFLQGSYRRATAVRPKGEECPDVDVIVVTNLDKDEVEPDDALEKFRPFLEKYYDGKYRKQGRSWGIKLSYVDLDLVPTAAPSKVTQEIAKAYANTDLSIQEFDLRKVVGETRGEAQWKSEPLWIPDRDAAEWGETDPLTQIEWTWDKNAKCNGHYVNVVKALKWWRLNNNPNQEHPKSYPLEHLVGTVCPNAIKTVAEGVTKSLENIVDEYPNKPVLPDRGLPKNDVFNRVSEGEYERFYDLVQAAAELARKALDADTLDESVSLWRELFGAKFPPPPDGAKNRGSGSENGGYTEREGQTVITPRRFA